jgi:SAM-dependent methyltransferase
MEPPKSGFSSFDELYAASQPPWDIGRPQQEFIQLAEAGAIQGSVLDAGCGTGEHALYLAALGHEAWGIDAAPHAIEQAQAKSAARGLAVEFRVWDALDLGRLGRTFDTVIDSGLFHVFSDEARPRYVRSLAAVLKPGGAYYLLCFSDREPEGPGPRRVSQAEIRATFGPGWRVNFIREAHMESRTRPEPVRAWLASVARA